MSRSKWKIPVVNHINRNQLEKGELKLERKELITPILINKEISIHNGKIWIKKNITEEMVGEKGGSIIETRKVPKHKEKKSR